MIYLFEVLPVEIPLNILNVYFKHFALLLVLETLKLVIEAQEICNNIFEIIVNTFIKVCEANLEFMRKSFIKNKIVTLSCT